MLPATSVSGILFQVLLCQAPYKLSYREFAEFCLPLSLESTYETVQDWQLRSLRHLTNQLKAKRKGQVKRHYSQIQDLAN